MASLERVLVLNNAHRVTDRETLSHVTSNQAMCEELFSLCSDRNDNMAHLLLKHGVRS